MSPGLLRGFALALAACLGAACSQPAPSGRSVLVVTLDTTRADALGCYGNRTARTPNLDRLAERGTLFERAYTVVPMTLPAHASMFTGLYPPRHTVRGNGPLPVPAAAVTSAEAARSAGLATAAFVSAAVLDPRFGLAQGFDTYDGPADGAGREQHNERAAAATVERARAWLRGAAGSDFFLWVHLFDPHAPYAPPPAFVRGGSARELYQGEVDATDAALGSLLEVLAETGAEARTLVIVVGDHGEALGDHGEATHGSLCYEPTLQVPLIVAAPGQPARRSARITSVVDVHPTALAWLGLALPGDGDGRSLLGEDPGSGGAYFEAYTGYLSYGWSPLAGFVDAAGKYVHTPTPEYFDLRADPGETRDLAGSGIELEPYRRAIARVFERPALDPASDAATDGALAEQIRALGYAELARTTDDLPHPLAPSDLPSPHRMADEERSLHALMEQVARGRCDAARPGLEALVARNGHNLLALDMLAHCAATSGDVDGAIATLQRLTAQSPPWPDSYQRLGGLLITRERTEEALAAFAAGLAVDPGHAGCLQALVRLLEATGRGAEAERYRALAR